MAFIGFLIATIKNIKKPPRNGACHYVIMVAHSNKAAICCMRCFKGLKPLTETKAAHDVEHDVKQTNKQYAQKATSDLLILKL